MKPTRLQKVTELVEMPHRKDREQARFGEGRVQAGAFDHAPYASAGVGTEAADK